MITHGHNIVPVEIKAGSTGTLKSLHVFMALKKLKTAVRVNADYPTVTEITAPVPNEKVSYKLLSIPFYLLGQVHRLIAEELESNR